MFQCMCCENDETLVLSSLFDAQCDSVRNYLNSTSSLASIISFLWKEVERVQAKYSMFDKRVRALRAIE